MENAPLVIALIGGFLLVASTPLWLLDAFRNRRARRNAATIEEFVSENMAELGYKLRLEIGPLYDDELQMFWKLATDLIAVTGGAIDKTMLVELIGIARGDVAAAKAETVK